MSLSAVEGAKGPRLYDWGRIQHLADILTHQTQVTATIRAAGAGVKRAALAWRGVRHTRATAAFAISGLVTGGCGRIISGRSGALSRRDQQVLQCKFELFDLALHLLRGFAESLLLELRNAQPSRQRRAFSVTTGSAGHGPGLSQTSAHSLPAMRRSSPSKALG
jgi:hypothetical protein